MRARDSTIRGVIHELGVRSPRTYMSDDPEADAVIRLEGRGLVSVERTRAQRQTPQGLVTVERLQVTATPALARKERRRQAWRRARSRPRAMALAIAAPILIAGLVVAVVLFATARGEDARYLNVVHATDTGLTDGELKSIGHDACSDFAQGMSPDAVFRDVASLAATFGYSSSWYEDGTAAVIVGAATEAYCSKYKL